MQSFDPGWDAIHSEQEWGKYPGEEVVRFVARNFYGLERSCIRLLDAGCGSGAVAWFLAREGFTVYGFDGSATAVEKAENRIMAEGLRAVFLVGDAANIPFPDRFFDGVIDSAMISANRSEHIKLILKECHRVLKSPGKFFSTGLFNKATSSFNTGIQVGDNTYRNLAEGPLQGKGQIHFFDKEEIASLWKKAGFSGLKIDSLVRSEGDGRHTIAYYMVEADK
ncbi:MAG: class I SAM-dependent methyltransferase [Syntrophomonadaceae bacterium]